MCARGSCPILCWVIRVDELRSSGAYVEVYPAEKDFTDTEAAVMCALAKGADEISILGATGGRLDHFLANLDLCLVPLRRGVKCTLADEHNELRLLDRGITQKYYRKFFLYTIRGSKRWKN